MSINNDIFDRAINHATNVRQYEESVQLQNTRILQRHRENLTKLLRENIRADVKKEVNRFAKELESHQLASMKEFSTSQIDFHTNNLFKSANKFFKIEKPTVKEFVPEVTNANIKGNRTIVGNVSNISAGEITRIQNRIKLGISRNQSPNDIIKDVINTTKITEVQTKTLTRTTITSTQNEALLAVGNKNNSVLKGYLFSAILDSRTSPICSYHNGRIYPPDDLRFKPPLHWNCRSTLIPVLKSKEELLDTTSVQLKKRNLKGEDPRNIDGVAPKIKSFGEWLQRQSMEIQSDILGSEEKANLFREGKLKYDQFITKAGEALSIAALRRKAAGITAVFAPRAKLKDEDLKIDIKTPRGLISPKAEQQIANLFILDSDDFSKTFSLTDFKGVTLVGKQDSRRRVGNELDERNFSTDPLTGEVKNNNIYDPDFNLLQERIDFMKRSKLLSDDQKNFIEGVTLRLDDKVSTNQQTVVVENLRIVLERYAKDKTPWDDLAAVIRAENRFSVQNVSRLLDTRARDRNQLFARYLTKDDGTPQVQIMGRYYSLDELSNRLLDDQRFIDNWRAKEGVSLARNLYFRGRAPLRVYFSSFTEKYPSKDKFIKNLRKEFPIFAKAYDIFIAKEKKPPSDPWITQQIAKIRESYRYIVDLEFLNLKEKPSDALVNDKALDTLTNIVKLIASGQSTDYDALAINIGKTFAKQFKDIIPFTTHTLADHHAEGSKILESLKNQGLIRVQFRGKLRRGVIDLDTGRPSGGWGDTISREVIVVNKELLKLQEAERRTVIARRLGVVNERDRLYVKAGNKVLFDARGNKTGLPLISSSKFDTFDEKQIDADFSRMLNHVMAVQYEVDNTFVNFMDDVLRFRDPRGNTKYYDSINEFRHEILTRGEQGYGLMATAKYHAQRQKPFRTTVFIDSRGRVYHRGYLTPTGGEVARPFLNSAREYNMTPEALDELRIQTAAIIGPATEALTQAGRRAIFQRNEQKVIELGELLLATTQRDRRIREFLEHPLIRPLEGKEVSKMARLALEYARINRHTNGSFTAENLSTYRTKLMIENDASSSGAQIIGLSTGDRSISEASNVLATTQKNRLYDLVAIDTVNDPEFLAIPALRNAGLTWEDLAKAAKAQNMVHFYGAGQVAKTNNVSKKLVSILEGKDFLVITKDDLNPNLRIIDQKIKDAKKLGAETIVQELTTFRKELLEVINKSEPVGRMLLKEAEEIHVDVADFVRKLTNTRKGLIGPKEFAAVSKIMSKNLSQRAPIADNFVKFWKKASKAYVESTKKVDIPWVTFDGKIMTQRYRPRIQERIEFTDPVTGRKVMNIYEGKAEDGKLLGKSSLADAGLGLGVNGNHANDAAIVRLFHLWGAKNNIDTATIHDAFFTNIAVARQAKAALREIYAEALEGDTVRKTLKQMYNEGLPYKVYIELLEEARRQGLIDPPNKITKQDILKPIGPNEDWYGIGP